MSPTVTTSSGSLERVRTTSRTSVWRSRSGRLTAFTGVSGSGKSSLVFATIAAESQRMINETYSTFVQGFMPTLARPDVDVLDGLTTAIIVDQERMGSDPRSTVGTATDASAMLRILFSRLGEPHIGSPQAFSFNVASISGAGAVTVKRAGQEVKERRSFSMIGGMCPRCEGRGSVTDFDLTELYDDSKSLGEGALTIPGYSMDGWYGRIYLGSGFFDVDKPIRKFNKRELNDLLYKEPTKIKVEGINLTYEGLIPRSKNQCWLKMSTRCSRTSERSSSGWSPSPPARNATEHGSANWRVRPRSRRSTSPRPVRCRSATSRTGFAICRSRRSRPCCRRCAKRLTRSSRSGSATCHSTGRPARCPGESRSGRR